MKRIIFILLVLIVFLLSACSINDNTISNIESNTSGNATVTKDNSTPTSDTKLFIDTVRGEPITLKEAISKCYIIAKASLIEICESDTVMGRSLYKFQYGEFLKGSCNDEFVEIIISDSDAVTSNDKQIYKIGQEYIILVDKYSNIFSGDSYGMYGSFGIQLEGNEVSEMYQRGEIYSSTDIKNLTGFKELISKNVANKNQNGEIGGIPYIDSQQPQEIIDFSPYIAKVKIDSNISPISDSEVGKFTVTVTELYKGNLTETFSLVNWKSDMEIGKEYLVCLVVYNDQTNVYAISSLNSCIAITETEKYEEYMKYIEK